MLVTICTIRQLPQAFALGDSFIKYAASPNGHPQVVIGLADNPANLPASFVPPFPLLPLDEVLQPVTELSSMYTPTEFAAACKPGFITEVFRRYPQANEVIYADPNLLFFNSLTPINEGLSEANALLTPFITRSPADACWPDEKFFQNIGLYSSDFLAFRRSSETDRLLAWWDDRVRIRARIDFCAGLCLDQIWLMHVPVLFKKITVVRNQNWHVGLWNLHERHLQQEGTTWFVTDATGQSQSLQFANFKGLFHWKEGFFPHQNRLQLTTRPDIARLTSTYQELVNVHNPTAYLTINPAYGLQIEPVVLRGWRQTTVQALKRMNRFIDKVPLPVIR
ncbi:hypothetical protein ACFSUS_02255 [Spirosoma soli]|uniref:Uncharacterized protein n=1 Tax=Spirosoma soli TaxID=1770529 RepID=A0ABW5M1D3_9BACT